MGAAKFMRRKVIESAAAPQMSTQRNHSNGRMHRACERDGTKTQFNRSPTERMMKVDDGGGGGG
jgi:hypothetical protein